MNILRVRIVLCFYCYSELWNIKSFTTASPVTDYISHKTTRHVLGGYVTCTPSFRLECKWIHDTVVWRKAICWKTVNVHKTTDVVLTPWRLTGPCRAGRDGGGPPDADDLAGPEGGWGVPVQPVRQAGELLGGEWSNRAEVESQPNKDYGRLDNPIKKLTLATTSLANS